MASTWEDGRCFAPPATAYNLSVVVALREILLLSLDDLPAVTHDDGSWLDIAETELSVFTRQCLNRRISDLEILRREATAWTQRRNVGQASVDWRYTKLRSDGSIPWRQ